MILIKITLILWAFLFISYIYFRINAATKSLDEIEEMRDRYKNKEWDDIELRILAFYGWIILLSLAGTFLSVCWFIIKIL